MDDFFEIVEIQKNVWGRDSLVYTSPHLIKVHVEMGALVLGAFEPAAGIIGFVYSFPGEREGRVMHWSHMLAVSPEARRRGTGKQLKWKQQEEIIRSGIDLCSWTFDPLQGINARLNIVALGAKIERYAINTYGTQRGYLDFGLPTDRFIVRWELDSPDVFDRLSGKINRVSDPLERLTTVLRIVKKEGQYLPSALDDSVESEFIGIQVPIRMNAMRRNHPDIAMRWRSMTREAFNSYLQRGYSIADVLTPEESSSPHFIYVLRK